MRTTPYIFFHGECAAALEHYGRVFGTRPTAVMRMSDAPPGMPIPDERKDWVMHCELPIGDGRIYMSDDIMSNGPNRHSGSSIMVELPTATEARKIFDALGEGGEITMEFQPTFWTTGFGTLIDRFGIRWMVGSEEEPQQG